MAYDAPATSPGDRDDPPLCPPGKPPNWAAQSRFKIWFEIEAHAATRWRNWA